jgi:hypothetical protein
MTNKSKTITHVFENYANNHKMKGYELCHVEEIGYPITMCNQMINVEKHQVPDKFSIILMQSISMGINTRPKLCEFLGLEVDDFVFDHMLFLERKGFIDESDTIYEITGLGDQFLKDKGKSSELHTKIESIDYEYVMDMVPENYKFGIDDINKTLYTVSVMDKYNIIRRTKYNEKNIIKVKDPKHNIASHLTSQFAEFFDTDYRNGTFYELTPGKKTHKTKMIIPFLMLVYTNKTDKTQIIDIRHFRDTVKTWKTNDHILDTHRTENIQNYISTAEGKRQFEDILVKK